MTLFGNHLAHPGFLLLLPLLIAAVVLALRQRLPSLVVPSLRPFVAGGARRGNWSAVRLPLLIEALGIACLIISLARPQHGTERQLRRTRGLDMMLAMDLSGSMEFIDLPEERMNHDAVVAGIRNGELRQRIDVAREEVLRFVDQRPHDRIGLVAFADNAYTMCPPTLDHGFLKFNVAKRLQPRLLGTNTGIAAPIASATARLKDSEAKRRVLVLFTDGKDTVDDAPMTPRQAARLAARFDIVIHTVGIGSDNAVVLERTLFGTRLQPVPEGQEFDRQLLEDLAAETRGRFFMARDPAGLEDVMAEIDELEKIEIEDPKYTDYRELFPRWMLAGLLLVGLAVLLEHTVLLKAP